MSTTAVGVVLPVDGPLPRPPAHNFWTVATGLQGRWVAGVSVWAFPPTVAAGIDPCASGTFRQKDEGDSYDNPLFPAFSAYLPITCSTFTGDWEGIKTRANEALNATDHVVAEKQLVSGTYVTAPYLAETTNLPAGSTAQSPSSALSYLENAIGATGREGVIHVDPATAIAFQGGFEVPTPDANDVLRTLNGTPVIVGSGYIGAKPDTGTAAAAGQSWAFASGPVFGDRSENLNLSEDIAESLDRTLNTLVYRAERHIVVGWDGQFSAAVKVDW